jgi:hypothetical protein
MLVDAIDGFWWALCDADQSCQYGNHRLNNRTAPTFDAALRPICTVFGVRCRRYAWLRVDQ